MGRPGVNPIDGSNVAGRAGRHETRDRIDGRPARFSREPLAAYGCRIPRAGKKEVISMSSVLSRITLCASALSILGGLAVRPAAAQTWTLSANTGIASGNRTDASFAWWGSLHRWVNESVGFGVEAGRLRWTERPSGIVVANDGVPFEGLAHGANDLEHLSGSVRLRGHGEHAVPVFTLTVGAYRQVIRTAGAPDPGDGDARLGFGLALGGAGTRTIAPGAEIRVDMVDTVSGSSWYLTAAFALHANR
jgi:hypothetical protein